MKRLVLFFLLFSGLLFGTEGRPVVLVTIEPYAFLVDRLAQGMVDVKCIVPPGANAHIFEPTLKKMRGFKEAKLWIRIGEGFEMRMAAVLRQSNPSLVLLEAWKGLPLISSHCKGKRTGCCGSWDRHVWLSPKFLKLQMPKMADALIALCPQQRGKILSRLNDFIKEMDRLDQNMATVLSKMKGHSILVAHPSFGYFCRDYGLKQLSIEQEGKDPLPKQLQTMYVNAKKETHRFVFVQPQFSHRGVKQVADKLALSLYTINPYAYNYLETLEGFAKAIAQEK